MQQLQQEYPDKVGLVCVYSRHTE